MAEGYNEGSGDLTKIGTSLLNMDDIALFLNKAKQFVTKKDKATDTEKVDGVAAENIALADTTDFAAGKAEKVDRNTVYNANHLAGRPVEDFFTTGEGGALVERQNNLAKNNEREFIELRDELYQLRADLAKRGVIDAYVPYSGFYDAFRSSDTRHVREVVGVVPEKSAVMPRLRMIVPDELYKNSCEGDHLFIQTPDLTKQCIVVVAEKDVDGRTLKLKNEATFEIDKDTIIMRSKGVVMNGTYSFGQAASASIDKGQTMYTGFTDDTYNHFLRLNKENPGYGYTFRIPKQMQNSYLSKLDILVRAHNNPGALTCYIIDEQDIEKWNNAVKNGGVAPTGETLEEIAVAKSQPLVVSAALDDHIVSFDFYDATKESDTSFGLTSPDCYPCLRGSDASGIPQRYCMIIEANPDTMDENNYYDVEFLNTISNGDLQLNNTTYHYDKKAPSPLYSDDVVNSYDLYYGITLLKAIEKDFTPYNDGIYTATWKEPEPIRSSYARLMLRVNREGLFHLAEGMGGSHVDGCSLNVTEEEPYGDGPLNNATTMVIGTEVRDVESVDGLNLTLKKGIYTEEGAPVYPIGYKVAIKASKETWDPQLCTMVTEYLDRYEMPLTCVMPDRNSGKTRSSDRLIFEAPLNLPESEESTIGRLYNKFELEIYWKKSCNNNLVEQRDKKYGTSSYVMAGAIKDLSLSLDRCIDA
jgi:hypothetical protein